MSIPPNSDYKQCLFRRGHSDLPKSSTSLKITPNQLNTLLDGVTVAKKGDVTLSEHGTTDLAVKYGDAQLAIFYPPRRGFMRCDRCTFPVES
jgi:hypothetical protein